ERIRDKLIDMATTTSPANAAEAPTSATKKFAQSASGAFIPTSCEIRPTSAPMGLEEPLGALEITQGAYGGRGDDRLWPIASDDALTANRRFRGIADIDRF